MLISEDQIQELYEINDDPKRKEFLDDLFSFMQKRGTPINRLPIMAKSVLDLYELYNLVIARGGLVDVINKKLWQEIIKGLHLPSSITSAAFTLRTQYMKYLYPYECEKKNLSTPTELQAAIDGNRREGRRSSYGQYEAIHNQIQMPQISRQSLPCSVQQISPLALVSHAANNQQAQAAAAAAAAHHRLMAPSFGQVPNIVTQEIEQRMIEYLKLIQVKKEQNVINAGLGTICLSPQQQRRKSQSPDVNTREALNALEMSRVALWQIYHNSSPPHSLLTSLEGGNTNGGENFDINEAQGSEALNLSDSPQNLNSVKRERDPSPDISKHNDFHHQAPPAKRFGITNDFYIPQNVSKMTDAIVAPSHQESEHEDSDAECGEPNIADCADTNDLHQLHSSSVKPQRHHGSNSSVHNDKSDDSAIENSPSTSAASTGNGTASPVSTKKNQLLKKIQVQQKQTLTKGATATTCSDTIARSSSSSPNSLKTLNLLSGMQFQVTQNGINSIGEQELMVNLELNGVTYSGVLISNTSTVATSSQVDTDKRLSTNDRRFSKEDSLNNESNMLSCRQNTDNRVFPNISDSNDEVNNDFVVAVESTEGETGVTIHDTKRTKDPSTSPDAITNDHDSNTNVLKDTLIEQ